MAAQIYYKVDSRRLTMGENWRFAKGRLLPFTILSLKKLFGSPMDFKHGIVRIDALTRLEAAQIPKDVQDALSPSVEQCAKLGADFQFLYTVPSLSATEGYAAAFLMDSGRIVPQVLFVRSVRRGMNRVRNTFACITKLADGRILSTVNQAAQWNSPEWAIVEHLPGAGVETVLERHKARMKALSGAKPIEISPDQLERVIVAHSQRTADDKIKKGVYVPMTPDEVERLKQFVEAQR